MKARLLHFYVALWVIFHPTFPSQRRNVASLSQLYCCIRRKYSDKLHYLIQPIQIIKDKT